MDSASAGLETTASNDGGKVKKARKRGKPGSCIPCSKKRQKCDRAHPCSSCVQRGTPNLCRWDPLPDGPSPHRSPHLEVDLSAEGFDDSDVNEDEIPPALRTTKLDLNENREMLKMLSKRISSLESRVVSGAGPASAPATVGPRRSSMSLDAMSGDGMGYGGGKIEGTFQPGSFGGGAASGVPGMVGGFDYVASAPILTGAGPLLDVSPAPSITFPSTHSPQTHVPQRPQLSRRQSEIGFRVPSTPQQDDWSQRVLPLSLVHPGEYVGRGNTACVLHSIRSSMPFRLPQAQTTAPTSISLSHVTPLVQALIPTPEIQHLIQYIPPIQSGNPMIDTFFKEVNWRYGLPEKWFSTTACHMWTDLQNPSQSHQLNPYWLSLFFSVLACTPQPSPDASTPHTRPPNTYDNDTYYVCASVARRIAEDSYFSSSTTSLASMAPHSSPVDGCALGCLAIPLLCDFLAERGRVSEAWKLMGYGVRLAQSIGLHREPGSPVWQDMPEEEKDLRRRAWWGLYIWDRLLSYVLGRPQMIHGDNCDVAKLSNVDGKGRKNSFNLSRVVLIQLADLVSEILDKCTGVEYPTWTVLAELDAKLESWELTIPAEFGPHTTPEQDIILFVGLSPQEIQGFARHRDTIITWYRLVRLKLYTIAIKRHQPTPSTAMRVESPGLIRDCAEKCVRLALELIKYQCDKFDRVRRTRSGEKYIGGNWFFEGCLSLFDAAVALLLVLTRFPTSFFPSPGAPIGGELQTGLRLEYDEMTRVISRVMDVFSEVVMAEKGFDNSSTEVREGKRAEVASKALDALQTLLKEHWWKLDPRSENLRPPVIDPASSPAQSSPRRTGSTPSTGMVGSPPTFPFPPATTDYSGSMYASQRPQLPFTSSSQQTSPIQGYPALVSPTIPETKPSPSSIQQQLHQQVQPNIYGTTAQYPMTTGAYSSSMLQPPFKNPPLSVPNPPYPSYSQNCSSEPSITLPPTSMSHLQNPSPYEYQPQNYGSLNTDFSTINPSPPPYSSPFPFTPVGPGTSQPQNFDQNPNQMYQNQNQPQYQQQPRIPGYQPPYQTPQTSTPNPSQHQTLHSNPAYTYNPTPSSAAGSSSSTSARPVRSSPGVPPPSQGMKMIHYVAPGSTTTSTTTASGMGVLGSSGLGAVSFTVSGMSQDTNRQGQQQRQSQPPQQQQGKQPEPTIVMNEFVPTTPTRGNLPGNQNNTAGGGSGGYV